MSAPAPYQFRKMSLKSIKCGSIMALIGKRGSGKSVLVSEFFYVNRKNMHRVVVFSSTEGVNQFYSAFVPKSFIHTKYDVEKLKSIYDAQKAFINANQLDAKKKGIKYEKNTHKDNLVIVIDDFMHLKNIYASETMRDLAFNGRHSNISMILLVQYAMILPSAYRAQIDICFMFKEVINANKKRLYDYYAGMFKTYSEFERIFDRMTNNWECMVIAMTNNSESVQGGIENMCYWYKATQPPKFKVCSKEIWEYDKKQRQKKIIDISQSAPIGNNSVRIM